MNKIKSRALSETAGINADLQSTIAMIKNIDQDQKIPMYYLKKEVESIITGIINTPSIEQLSEYMDFAITPVLLLLDEIMKHLELSTVAEVVGNNAGICKIEELENKLE